MTTPPSQTMQFSRRKTLALIGGGLVLAAGGSATAFALTRTPNRALAPWDTVGVSSDVRLYALSYAILAPNPHNRQPWMAELVGDNQIRIYRDPTRDLPETDPHSRQLTIGMGAFLELLSLAAAERGFTATFDLFPEGEAGPVAVARMEAGGKPDPLFKHVLDRRSVKEPFEPRPVPPADIEALSVKTLLADARIITDDQKVSQLKALTWDAWMTEAMTPRTNKESVDLMRFGKSEIEANPDGIDLGGPMLEALMLAGLLSREAQLDPRSSGFQQGVAIYKEMLAATPAYVVMTSATNTRADQIAAGRRWTRFNLATTARGLSLHPVSQCLQEFAEMAPHYKRAHELLAAPGETVQMLGRLGYGPIVPRTPRWPLETRLKNA
jgi:hypothetical protein